MKRFFLATLASITFLGAGCSVAGIPLISDQVKGDWTLAFDLPEGWVMAQPYSEPSDKVVELNMEITRTTNEVVLSSTNKPIVVGGIAPDNSVPADSYVADDFTIIHAYRLDERRVIPSEAEDLGDGWYRVKICEEGEDCQIYGRSNYEYYLVTETAKYKFTINTRGQSAEDALGVIMSAEEVTNFTDGASVEAETK